MEDLRKKLKKVVLTERNNYTTVNIDYSDYDRKILKKIRLKNSQDIVLYGTYGMHKKINDLLCYTVSNKPAEIKYIIEIIKKIIHTVIKSFNEDSALVHIRVTQPNDDFKVPRWHADGKYYMNRTKPHYKFVTALIGPSTLLHKNDQTKRAKIIQIRRKFGHGLSGTKKENQIRKKILKFMNDKKNITIPGKYQAGVYLVGVDKYSAFHSEPDINTDRIFLAILPGKKKEVAVIKKRWTEYKKKRGMKHNTSQRKRRRLKYKS